MSLTPGGTLTLKWIANLASDNAVYNDQVMLMIYCPELELVDGMLGGTSRADRQCSKLFDQRMIGKRLEVYVSLFSANGKKVANSVYMGRIG